MAKAMKIVLLYIFNDFYPPPLNIFSHTLSYIMTIFVP